MNVFPALLLAGLAAGSAAQESLPDSLTGQKGDPARGRAIVVNRQTGLCLLCHSGPFPEEASAGQTSQGDLAPNLRGAGKRWTEAQLRLRIVDPMRLNPATIMPAYGKSDGLWRVSPAFRERALLSPQQIETWSLS